MPVAILRGMNSIELNLLGICNSCHSIVSCNDDYQSLNETDVNCAACAINTQPESTIMHRPSSFNFVHQLIAVVGLVTALLAIQSARNETENQAMAATIGVRK